MEPINYFEKIREYLNSITAISNKLASDITEKDLAKLDAYSCCIWELIDMIESEGEDLKEFVNDIVVINSNYAAGAYYSEDLEYDFGYVMKMDEEKWRINKMEMKTYRSTLLYDIYEKIRKLWHTSLHHSDLIGNRYVIEYDVNDDVFILMYYAR